ncbi:hypothetical protein GMA11_06575 [Granulicatella sp. zg-ZJ]|uniref:barstar family protein n=1 Tax=Granulicatella sp. zg-ZJ TaxID=2678504 RepID=UPI0013D6F719|nr:barstar family protein [Granulicatella sp. zg-ZJ]NEW63058.1 hypothetical protein [Granulicatella sp. zg-ZJ]
MKNKIYYVTSKQWEFVYNNMNKDNLMYFEIDGKEIQTVHAFIDAMIETFRLPDEHRYRFTEPERINGTNWPAFRDRMTDLLWFDDWTAPICFVIKNFSQFIVETKSDREHANDSEYIRDKEYIMWNFEEVILPFWEEEIEQIVVGGEKRVFNVYCVD